MKIYQITQQTTGIVLFEGEATDEADALNKMAEDAGYDHYDPDEFEGGETLIVREIK